MEKYKIITILLFFLNSNAQEKNIYVEYSVKVHNDELFSRGDESFTNFFKYTKENDENFSFGLIINKKGSKFFEAERLNNDNKLLDNVALSFMNYSGVIYEKGSFLYSNSISAGTNRLVKRELKKNWVLHNESKTIDNYLCYKATNVKRVENNAGIFEFPVTAWYCPKLPYRYGPNGYSNLPGLILELQERNVVFGAKKIILNSDLNFDIEFLKTVNTISEEELYNNIKEEFEELRKQYGE